MTCPLCYEAKQRQPMTSARRKPLRARTAVAITDSKGTGPKQTGQAARGLPTPRPSCKQDISQGDLPDPGEVRDPGQCYRIKSGEWGCFPRTALGSRESGLLRGSHAYELRTSACKSVRQNWTKGRIMCPGLPQGYSASQAQEGGGSWKGEEIKGIKCQKARSSPTYLSGRREARRKAIQTADEGPPVC